jgi:hypothetical protein
LHIENLVVVTLLEAVERFAVKPVLLAKIVLAPTRGIEQRLLMLAQKPGDLLLVFFFDVDQRQDVLGRIDDGPAAGVHADADAGSDRASGLPHAGTSKR